jgi:hypothetical protein
MIGAALRASQALPLEEFFQGLLGAFAIRSQHLLN